MEEAPPCHVIINNVDLSPAAKGKRTKRHRPHSPAATPEEEETAATLILLSQGHFQPNPHEPKPAKRAADCMYACKTCGRAFSSFQALGGHRTSHKKPKIEKRRPGFSVIDDDDYPSPRTPPPSLSLKLSSTDAGPSPRVHECSFCGAEFTSGQALGGHMRRHRAGPGPISPSPSPDGGCIGEERPEPAAKKARNGLCLDLNFPAPEDEIRRSGFESGPQKGPEKLALSITTPTLVDCQF